MDIFEKYSEELNAQKSSLKEKLDDLNQKLSNPKDMINFTLRMASKLGATWSSGDFHEKQNFQVAVFPFGLGYDSKKEDYRTPKINDVFGYIAHLSRGLEGNEKRTSLFLAEKSDLVPPSRPNMNELLEDTRDFARIWDLYGHLIGDTKNSLSHSKV